MSLRINAKPRSANYQIFLLVKYVRIICKLPNIFTCKICSDNLQIIQTKKTSFIFLVICFKKYDIISQVQLHIF